MSDTTAPHRVDRATEVDAFFDEFDADFLTFDGDVIAQRFGEPYLACRADGSSAMFPDRAATGRYFGGVLADYRAMGVRSCAHRDLDVVDVGGRHVLATVTWDLFDQSGAVVVSWRESYLLVVGEERLRVRTSIDAALEPPTTDS